MTELKQFWHLFSTRIVPVLWIIAMICAVIEFGLAQLIQRLTQRGALTMPLMMMAVVAAGVIGGGRWLIARWQTRAHYQLTQTLQSRLMAALMNGPVSVDLEARNERLNSLTTEAPLAAPLFIKSVTAILVGLLSFLAASLFGWLSSWPLMLIIIGLCLTALLIPKVMAGRLTQAQDTQQSENARTQAALLEILAGRMLLKDYQKEQFGLQLFSRTYQSFADSQYRMGLQQTGTIVMGFALGLFVDIVILGVELLFVGFKFISIGQFAAFAMLTPSFTWLFYSMPDQYAQLSRNLVAAKRIFGLIVPLQAASRNVAAESQEAPSAHQPKNSVQQLLLKHITYTYPDASRPVLAQLDLKLNVAAHEKILITGPSGGGKSTLIRIILGLLSPQAGSVQIEPATLEAPRQLAHIIGFVPQVVALFDDTLRQNIALDRNVSQTALSEVLVQTDLQTFVQRLPEGLATPLHGQTRANVSAGELQKIGLARALLARRNVLVLDEPFANLDAAAAKSLSQRLRQLPVALIVISHRQDVEQFWDRALQLEHGRLNEAKL